MDLDRRLARFLAIVERSEAKLATKGERPSADDVLAAAHDQLLAILQLVDGLGGFDVMAPVALKQLVDAVIEVKEGRPSALLVPAHIARKLKLGDNPAAKPALRRKAYAAVLMQMHLDDGHQRQEASRLVAAKLTRMGFKAKPAGVDRSWDDAQKGQGPFSKKFQYYRDALRARPNTVSAAEMLENWAQHILSGTAR